MGSLPATSTTPYHIPSSVPDLPMHAQTCNTSQCNVKGPHVLFLHDHMPQQAVILSASKSHNRVCRTKTRVAWVELLVMQHVTAKQPRGGENASFLHGPLRGHAWPAIDAGDRGRSPLRKTPPHVHLTL